MGIIKEPKDVDFIVGPERPTEEDFKKISAFIKKNASQKAVTHTKKKAVKSTSKPKVV